MATLYTIGYGGRTPSQVADLLRKLGVGVLVDVRASPRSRVPGFSKAGLESFMPSHGVLYHHVEALGNANRFGGPDAPVQLVDEVGGLEWLRGCLNTRQLTATLRGVAIMCTERDYWGCHRTYIADKMTGFEVVHIT